MVLAMNKNNHPTRNGRLSAMEMYQPLPHIGHNRLEESYQKQRQQLSNEEKAEKVNSDLEKMIQFMTVIGQIDRYLSSKAKSFVSTLGRAMEGSSDDHQVYDDNNKMMSTYDY